MHMCEQYIIQQPTESSPTTGKFPEAKNGIDGVVDSQTVGSMV